MEEQNSTGPSTVSWWACAAAGIRTTGLTGFRDELAAWSPAPAVTAIGRLLPAAIPLAGCAGLLDLFGVAGAGDGQVVRPVGPLRGSGTTAEPTGDGGFGTAWAWPGTVDDAPAAVGLLVPPSPGCVRPAMTPYRQSATLPVDAPRREAGRDSVPSRVVGAGRDVVVVEAVEAAASSVHLPDVGPGLVSGRGGRAPDAAAEPPVDSGAVLDARGTVARRRDGAAEPEAGGEDPAVPMAVVLGGGWEHTRERGVAVSDTGIETPIVGPEVAGARVPAENARGAEPPAMELPVPLPATIEAEQRGNEPDRSVRMPVVTRPLAANGPGHLVEIPTDSTSTPLADRTGQTPVTPVQRMGGYASEKLSAVLSVPPAVPVTAEQGSDEPDRQVGGPSVRRPVVTRPPAANSPAHVIDPPAGAPSTSVADKTDPVSVATRPQDGAGRGPVSLHPANSPTASVLRAPGQVPAAPPSPGEPMWQPARARTGRPAPRFGFGAARSTPLPSVVPYGASTDGPQATGGPRAPAAVYSPPGASPAARRTADAPGRWPPMPVVRYTPQPPQPALPQGPQAAASGKPAAPSPQGAPLSAPGAPAWEPVPAPYPGSLPESDVTALAHEIARSQTDVLVRALLPVLDRHRRRGRVPPRGGTPVPDSPR